MDFNIINFKVIDSTNSYLKANYHKYPEKTVILADYQTQGYGRMGREWVDQKGQNLTFSLLLYPRIDKSLLSQITLFTCVSIFEVLKAVVPNIAIKWPNDLLVGNKKLAGILTETIFLGSELKALIIGVGINVGSTSFQSNLKGRSTSIYLETNQLVDKTNLLDAILNSFKRHYNKFLEGDKRYLEIFKENFPYLNQKVEIILNDQVKQVKILDVLDNGNLFVKTDDKMLELAAGEISIKR